MQRVLTMVSLGDLVDVTAAEEQISTITDLHPAWKKNCEQRRACVIAL